MSVTTTANPITLSLQQTLGDYEVHVTGNSQDTQAVESPNSRRSNVVSNPPSWPRNYHRVPPRRPVNRDLVWSERPLGSNPGEKLFLNVMFSGVSLNAGVAQLWGATGGKVFTKTFKYAIGGEW
ncbi:hypothetical protein DL95DRAFT_440238 [Leptodontidium sp. 2 PMI_412]|nr:hypothetical protein BKA61DRAFT_509203 [Leptodontidium sp. MPI-SDFR-AT-0119]KAH9224158.1 hypothetical protein DL95DRAFT_440238 [Leptodontidium sp. 2 PMI_412]